nr:PREDICTED: cysteinyl leukotriene receptor 2-like [Paralichthys olivaceus]XP_019964952.1 PREDICTED: cysteinyl leukotriene receptor 2-like [Paralichthys olivaceus]XP_019964953.1 PREDICTED: cysteinyl leukotriene receptor 2-like [Paralichthys olivaceus]
MNAHLQTLAIAIGNNTSMMYNNSLTCSHADESFKYYAYCATYLVVFPVAFLCNIGALVVFILQSLRSSRCSTSCVVMMNLALSDSFFSLTLPLRLTYYFSGGVWQFSDWLCRVCSYSFYVYMYTSILFLTLLSLFRWLAVAQPLLHSSQATPTRTILVCLGIWVFVAVSSSPFLLEETEDRSGHSSCFEPSSQTSWEHLLIMNYVGLAVGFLLPFFTIIICYSSLIRHLMAKSSLRCNQPTQQHNRQRSVHLVSMVIVTFLFCFLPYHMIRPLHLHAILGNWNCNVIVVLQRTVVLTLCMAAFNSVVNPLLYYYSAKTFRKDMRDVSLSLFNRERFSFMLRGQL